MEYHVYNFTDQLPVQGHTTWMLIHKEIFTQVIRHLAVKNLAW